MKHKWWFLMAFLIAGAGAILTWNHFRAPKLSQYQTARVTVGDVNSSVAATGNLNAVVTVQVGSQVSGNIKTLYADFNTKVGKGQIVALIDPEMFQARVNQARANLDNARASVLNAQAVAKKAEADIASAIATRENVKAQVLKAQADLRNADLQLQRRLALCAKGLTNKEDCDNAQAAYDASAATVQAMNAQVNAADQNVKAAEAQHEVTLAQIEATSAQVRQCQAALDQAEVDLAHTRIVAPVDGTVIARRMDVGQTVAASFQAPTIFEIAQDLAKMQVDTNIDESDVGGIRVGQRASFSVDAFPAKTFRALVAQIRKAPINVQNVITYDVVLTLDNSDLKLFPGMTANVRIFTDSIKNALKVPNAAFRFKLPGETNTTPGRKQSSTQTLHILDTNGSVRPVQVATGLTDGNFTAISDETLREGDLVIVGIAGTASSAARLPTRGPTF